MLLIGLAHAVGEDKAEPETDRLMMESLFATLTNVNFDDESLKKQIEAVHQEKGKICSRLYILPGTLRAHNGLFYEETLGR